VRYRWYSMTLHGELANEGHYCAVFLAAFVGRGAGAGVSSTGAGVVRAEIASSCAAFMEAVV